MIAEPLFNVLEKAAACRLEIAFDFSEWHRDAFIVRLIGPGIESGRNCKSTGALGMLVVGHTLPNDWLQMTFSRGELLEQQHASDVNAFVRWAKWNVAGTLNVDDLWESVIFAAANKMMVRFDFGLMTAELSWSNASWSNVSDARSLNDGEPGVATLPRWWLRKTFEKIAAGEISGPLGLETPVYPWKWPG